MWLKGIFFCLECMLRSHLTVKFVGRCISMGDDDESCPLNFFTTITIVLHFCLKLIRSLEVFPPPVLNSHLSNGLKCQVVNIVRVGSSQSVELYNSLISHSKTCNLGGRRCVAQRESRPNQPQMPNANICASGMRGRRLFCIVGAREKQARFVRNHRDARKICILHFTSHKRGC